MPLIASAKRYCGTKRGTIRTRWHGKETERSIFPNCPSKCWNSSLSVTPISRHSVCIDDETLAEAISALPVDRRDIILLSYFLDMSDAEIANVLNMVRRSVAYRRTSTLKLLKNLMGGENR